MEHIISTITTAIPITNGDPVRYKKVKLNFIETESGQGRIDMFDQNVSLSSEEFKIEELKKKPQEILTSQNVVGVKFFES